MRTTVEIPDETYRELKIKAAREGTSVREIVLRGIERELVAGEPHSKRKQFQIPLIPSSEPGTLHLTNEDIDELIDLPEPLYREMKALATAEGTTIREIILEKVALRLRQGSGPAKESDTSRFPVIESRNPGSLKLGEEGVYEYIPFP